MANFELGDNGIPALTLALRLRLKGHAVALIPSESSAQLPEVFTLPAPYRDLMLKSGGALEEVSALVPAAPLEFPVGDAQIRLPHVGPHAPAIAASLGAETGAQWASFTRAGADIWSTLRTGTFHSTVSLRHLRKLHLRDRRLQALLDAYLAASGIESRAIGEAAAVLPYLDQTFGRWSLTGGLAALEGELRQRCHSLGVTRDPNQGQALSLDNYWAGHFLAPARRWQRTDAKPVSAVALGLPWVGMAAELIADRIGRAAKPDVIA